MPDRGDPADGKAGLRPDQRRISLAQGLAGQRGGFGRVDLTPARGDEQHRVARGLGGEDDGFGDLVERATRGCGGILRGARAGGHFLDFGRDPGGVQGGFDTFEALGHGRMSCRAATRALQGAGGGWPRAQAGVLSAP